MTDRASLIEKAARAIMDRAAAEPISRFAACLFAEAALSAIAPPGEAWVAPWEASLRMMAAAVARNPDLVEPYVAMSWADMRDAHLNLEGDR